MIKNSNGRFIRTNNKQELIYIRQDKVYFIYCIKEDEEE
jgi:hypothetical protein